MTRDKARKLVPAARPVARIKRRDAHRGFEGARGRPHREGLFVPLGIVNPSLPFLVACFANYKTCPALLAPRHPLLKGDLSCGLSGRRPQRFIRVQKNDLAFRGNLQPKAEGQNCLTQAQLPLAANRTLDRETGMANAALQNFNGNQKL